MRSRKRLVASLSPAPLSAWRAGAKARGRRTEYLARAYRCGDMAVRASTTHDAQFLRAMTLVWQVLADQVLADKQVPANQVLADKTAGAREAAEFAPPDLAQLAPPLRGATST